MHEQVLTATAKACAPELHTRASWGGSARARGPGREGGDLGHARGARGRPAARLAHRGSQRAKALCNLALVEQHVLQDCTAAEGLFMDALEQDPADMAILAAYNAFVDAGGTELGAAEATPVYEWAPIGAAPRL